MFQEKIIFFGTGTFSCAILKMLKEEKYNVIAAVSQPDRPVGRKHIITATPVHALCTEMGIACLQPEKLRKESHLVTDLKPDLIITCSYGQIVPDDILACPEKGCLNIHPSLLPKYRGASPMHFPIINGDTETGVSLMEMTHAMDAGRVYAQVKLPIGPDDTEADMYEAAVRILAEHGYHQYETANFCLPQKESVHNSAYWNYMDFYGISCGASGKENHRRYDHTRSLRQYIEDPSAVEYTDLSPDDEKFEMIMMGLRLKRGMDLNLYKERFGEPAEARFGRALAKMKEQKMLEEHDGYLRATDRGFEILNEILVEFLDG